MGEFRKDSISARRGCWARRTLAGLAVIATLGGCAVIEQGDLSDLDYGILLMNSGELDRARSQFENILAEDPNNPYAQLNMGVVMQRLGDFPAASRHYRIAVLTGASSPVRTVASVYGERQVEETVASVAGRNLATLQ